jgi:hypothetical protein
MKNKAPKGHDVVLDIKPVDGVNKENEFYFISAERRVLVCAKTPQIMSEWVNAVSSAKRRGPKTSTVTDSSAIEELFDSKTAVGSTQGDAGFLEVTASYMPWETGAGSSKNSDAKDADNDKRMRLCVCVVLCCVVLCCVVLCCVALCCVVFSFSSAASRLGRVERRKWGDRTLNVGGMCLCVCCVRVGGGFAGVMGRWGDGVGCSHR